MIIGDYPEDQLAPYDENLEVEEYSKPLLEEDKSKFVHFYEQEHPEVATGKSFDELYPIYGKDWDGNVCRKNADGEWERWSTYNPKSKWDWYQLGGRWSGLIQLKEGAEGIEGESGVFSNETGIDQARKGDILNLNEIKVLAVIKDGKWYERGEMGWWGIVSNEKPEEQWDQEFKTLINDLTDDTLISIYDCHI